MWFKAAIVFCFAIEALKTDAKSYPVNTVAIVGQNVTMHCEVSSYDNSSWNHVSSAAPWTFLIASGGNVSSVRYSLITDPKSGQYDLQIKQTIQNDSGTYVCTETNRTTGTTKKHSAQLILLMSDPECGTDLTGPSKTLDVDDYVSMWCVLEYRGHRTPTMVWRHSGHGRVIPAEEDVHPNHKIESRITVKVGLCENGVTFSCTTFFTEADVSNDSSRSFIIFADNVLDYTYKWTSPMLKVTQFSWNDPRAITMVFFLAILSVAVISLGAIIFHVHYDKQAEETFNGLQRGDAGNKTCPAVDGECKTDSKLQPKYEDLDQSKSKLNPEGKGSHTSTADDRDLYDKVE